MDTNITYDSNLDYDFSKLPETEIIPVIFKPSGKWWNNEVYQQAKNNIPNWFLDIDLSMPFEIKQEESVQRGY